MSRRIAPRRLRTRIAFLALALLGLLAVSPVHADTVSQLKSAEARLNALINRIGDESKVVNDLDAQAAVLAGQINQVQDRLAYVEASVVQTQSEISQTTDQLLATQGQLDQRARTAYENGPGSGLEFLLGSTSLTDLNTRLEIVNRAAQSDNQLIAGEQNLQAQLTIKQTKLESLQSQLRAMKANLDGQNLALQAKFAQAKRTLDQMNADRAAAEKLVRNLKVKRQQEIARQRLLEQQSQHGNQGGSIGGVLLVCPVDPPQAYSDDFGAPRYGGGFHHHAGNDILAPMGTPIRAPFDGVATISSNGLGGNSVTVTGAAGFVYNAHLSAFGQLGSVRKGTVVGYVGATGDAQGSTPHDHFEWHPNVIPQHLWTSPYGFSLINGAIDPYPYLNSVC